MSKSKNERRFAVLVTYGTLSWRMPYAMKCTLAEARVLKQTAIQHRYDDAEIVENYEPNRRGEAA